MNRTELQAWFDEVDQRNIGAAQALEQFGTEYYSDLALVWVADAESALVQAFPKGHPICTQWGERLADAKGREWEVRRKGRIDSLRAIFRSATGQLRAGRLSTLVDGIRAEDACELLDQAEQLARAGHHVGGAVIAGGALETTLRHLCDKAGLSVVNGSIAKYQQAMAQARNAGSEVISASDEKQVIAWGGLRNEAAHTPVEFATKQTAADVVRMIEGVRAFVAKYT